MNHNGAITYAGFWRRSAAWCLDLLILAPVTLALLHLVYGRSYWRSLNSADAGLIYGLWDPVINYALPMAFVIVFWTRIGATPGKWVMGCRVLDARNGRLLPVGRALLRFVCYLASYLPLGLGFLWAAWDRRKQGFHDKLARTVVVVDEPSLPTLDEIRRSL